MKRLWVRFGASVTEMPLDGTHSAMAEAVAQIFDLDPDLRCLDFRYHKKHGGDKRWFRYRPGSRNITP